MTEISKELERLEESSEYSAQNQFEQAKIWKAVHLWLAVPAALLGAVTGGSLLADEISPVLAGILALVAAGLAGVLATVKAAERGEVCQRVGNEYLALQRDARIARNVDLREQAPQEARDALGELVARQNELNAVAPIPSTLARSRGQRNITAGGQTYRADLDAG